MSQPQSKLISLPNEKFAIVDADMFEYLNQWKWHLHGKGYAVRGLSKPNGKYVGWVHMHRVVNNTPEGYQTDHINGNKLDNRRCNLRTVTNAQNQHNIKYRKDNTSGVRGVTWNKQQKQWGVYLQVNNKQLFFGYFKNIVDATVARKKAEEQYHAI